MKAYIWNNVIYYITEEEFYGLRDGWLNPKDMFD